MKKLTPFELENLIESLIQDEKKIIKRKKYSYLTEKYLKRWEKCKTKLQKETFFENMLIEKHHLINEGISKNSVDESIMDFFSAVGSGGWKTFKEFIITKIVKKVAEMFGAQGDPDLIKAISIGLANVDWFGPESNWKKLLSPLKNCNFFGNAIVDGVMEYYIDKKVNEWLGTGSGSVVVDTIRNAVVDSFKDQKNVQAIQDVIIVNVCKALQGLFSMAKPSPTPTPSMS